MFSPRDVYLEDYGALVYYGAVLSSSCFLPAYLMTSRCFTNQKFLFFDLKFNSVLPCIDSNRSPLALGDTPYRLCLLVKPSGA